MLWWQVIATCGGFTVISSLVVAFIRYQVLKHGKSYINAKKEAKERGEKLDKCILFILKHGNEVKNNTKAISELYVTNGYRNELLAQLKDDIANITKSVMQLRGGLQANLRNALIHQYNIGMTNKSVSLAEKDNFENMYKHYELLGENGVIDDIHSQYMALPTK